MMETRLSVSVAVSSVKEFSFKIMQLCLKVLNTSAEEQLCDNAFQTEGALTLKALAKNESAILGTDGTDSNSLSADRRSVLVGSRESSERGKHECQWFSSHMQRRLSCMLFVGILVTSVDCQCSCL